MDSALHFLRSDMLDHSKRLDMTWPNNTSVDITDLTV